MKKFHLVLISIIFMAGACTENFVELPDSTDATIQQAYVQISVQDSLGRELKFDVLPERVIVAGKATTLLLDSLYLFPEAESKIYAIENRSQNTSNFLTLIDPFVAVKMRLPKDVGIEEIAAAKPDLIILKQVMAEKLGDPLENLGFDVFYINMETPAAFLQEIQSLGTIFGNTKRGSEINLFYQEQISEINSKIANIDIEAYPSVLLLQASNAEGIISFSVPPASWLQTSMVELAGGIPVWKETVLGEGWETVTFEQIAAWNPDLIFIINYEGESHAIVENLNGSALWAELSAVQNDQLEAFAGDYISWDQPDSRWILGLQFLANKIHPELFEDYFLQEKIELFFSEMYGLDEEQIRNQITPLIK